MKKSEEIRKAHEKLIEQCAEALGRALACTIVDPYNPTNTLNAERLYHIYDSLIGAVIYDND